MGLQSRTQLSDFHFTSLCITGSRFIHLTRTASNSFLLSAKKYFIVYMHHNFFQSCIYTSSVCCMYSSFIDRHRGCFHVRAIVNSAAINTRVHVSFRIMVFSGYMPSSGIAGSYGGFIPSFLRNLHTILHSGPISLHSHQQLSRAPRKGPIYASSSSWEPWLFLGL